LIVDTSAIVAVLAGENDAALHAAALVDARSSTMSAAAYVECGIVLDRHASPTAGWNLDQFLIESRIGIASFTPEQARLARMAYRDFGRGSGHPARLNFGDCFSYALAIDRNEPLLYKGDDFGHTDVRSALAG
jgi:ribonuclease VapC